MNLKIIYEDNDLQVLDKPPGLVVTEIQGLLAHRLDKDTSGVLLVAKTQEALDNLQAQFKQRVIKKEYLALVHGIVAEAGVVEGAIGRNPGNREKFTVLPGAREAETEYEPLEKFKVQSEKLKVWFPDFNKIQMRKLERMQYNQFTLLKCFPKTGRTHQIRVHLKHIGYPIVSDDKYAGRKMNRLDRRWCPRMFLHAAKIGFKHPATGKWMEIESELPEDLEKAFKIFNF
ncbi:hypothetical protein A3B42_03885 [Candidatus Daviesbacteria bacterium RIFCSPLOWO2_01_FULL_38_10]|nr:MAG: hypothetical protein A3D02_03945 [Candidatus Daviesbacteria bacterium RIFCSPHIGHO2_02_FULL_39_41]OGE38405.1 MAG: hypothetical protein A3B42_03885 [Candidatus Daviesbacteria bacterium RIFCSPLOWO2_01_FULL_38_10]OGE45521.1 MAG: hypothetical protein A3E67_00070 [Candidatus Daviesbacteria bacterium RIFCSPHIGHO2_12_FULL_38_25]OGE68834.1 MAG: hypothetical protein A3H81_04605 [Candidatus Daviesbacteria bacterium RIFCSPLOWO2_02_FULL_38_18]OGE73248.1 MAG: hypothetical protein A3H18_04880 [Candida